MAPSAYLALVSGACEEAMITYHCLICDSPAILPAHAVLHGWDLDRVRQVGFEWDTARLVATHEYAAPGGPSLFYMVRQAMSLEPEIDA